VGRDPQYLGFMRRVADARAAAEASSVQAAREDSFARRSAEAIAQFGAAVRSVLAR
jgi:hypothetical protein